MDKQVKLLRELDDIDEILSDLKEGIDGESLESETYKLMVSLYTQRRQAFLNELTTIDVPEKGAVYIMFGSFNPPTMSHEFSIDYLTKTAKSAGADTFVFVSSQENSKNHPLPYGKKVQYLREFFPSVKIYDSPTMKSVFDALHVVKEFEYSTVNLFVRDEKEMKMAEKIKQRLPSLPITQFDIILIPQMVGGIADMAMRKFATKNDFESFRKNLPSRATEQDAVYLFDSVRKFSVDLLAI